MQTIIPLSYRARKEESYILNNNKNFFFISVTKFHRQTRRLIELYDSESDGGIVARGMYRGIRRRPTANIHYGGVRHADT